MGLGLQSLPFLTVTFRHLYTCTDHTVALCLYDTKLFMEAFDAMQSQVIQDSCLLPQRGQTSVLSALAQPHFTSTEGLLSMRVLSDLNYFGLTDHIHRLRSRPSGRRHSKESKQLSACKTPLAVHRYFLV